uniref:EF-hand domain-containing protein n=1 Tax=Panagrolaimus sp. PS1159 TaxID=55785 RepID=A0AC35GJ75_9BILA
MSKTILFLLAFAVAIVYSAPILDSSTVPPFSFEVPEDTVIPSKSSSEVVESESAVAPSETTSEHVAPSATSSEHSEGTAAAAAADEDHVDHPEIIIQTETPAESFVRADTDEDIQLTFDEFLKTDLSYVQVKKAEFDQLDSNSDGILSLDEFSTFYRKQDEDKTVNNKKYYIGLFKEFDENNDKQLSQTEVKRILSKRFLLKPKENFGQLFEKFDSDGNGALNLGEYQKFDQTFPFYELEPIQVAVQ